MTSTIPNPLLDLHRQTEAEFQSWGDVLIVQTFGVPQTEYAAIYKSAGLIDLPQRGILELTGRDRLSFLNNLLTNQIWDKTTKAGMSTGQVAYAFMLNLRGRVVVDMNVLELGDRTLLEMDARLIEPLRQVLDKYLFGEQVKLASRLGQLHEIALHGPSAEKVLNVSFPEGVKALSVKVAEVDVIVWRDDPTVSPGYHLIVPIESAPVIWASLVGSAIPVKPIGWAAFNATRVEAGRVIFGIDFDGAPISSALPGKPDQQPEDGGAGMLPAETGAFDRAVSVTKGCYLGQEIVARMHARAQVARQIVGVRMDDGALPIAGAEVFDENSTLIGVVTSSTVSPVLSNAALCLATVKRPHFAIGTKLQIPAEGAIRSAKVVQLPFYKAGQSS